MSDENIKTLEKMEESATSKLNDMWSNSEYINTSSWSLAVIKQIRAQLDKLEAQDAVVRALRRAIKAIERGDDPHQQEQGE